MLRRWARTGSRITKTYSLNNKNELLCNRIPGLCHVKLVHTKGCSRDICASNIQYCYSDSKINYSTKVSNERPHHTTIKSRKFSHGDHGIQSITSCALNNILTQKQSQCYHHLNLESTPSFLLNSLSQSYSTSASQQTESLKLTSTDQKLRQYMKKFKCKYEKLLASAPSDAYKLQPVINLLQELECAEQDVVELEKLAAESAKDQELAALAAEDLVATRGTAEQLTQKVLQCLISQQRSLPTAGRDVTIELSAGIGGVESMLFCQQLWDMYQGYCTSRGWAFVHEQYSKSELDGLRLGLATVRCPNNVDVFSELRYEAGIHRVQRVPKTEKGGRIHTSTVAVVVMLQPKEVDIQISNKDLRIDTMKSSGPGGQSVNTTDSAVRITHLPTGTAVECQEERNQHQNKARAMQKLRSILFQRELDKEIQSSTTKRKLQVGSRGRSEKIRTYNFPQDRVTDHRIGAKLHNMENILQGGSSLQQLLDKLREFAAHETLLLMIEKEP